MVEVREAKGLRAPTLQLNGEHTALHARVHLALRARAPPLACLSVGLGPQPLFQLARTSPAPTDERLREVRITGDGRCMFRALALGLAANKNVILGGRETEEADQLRMACADAMCTTQQRRQAFPEAYMSIKVEQDINRYCKRIGNQGFWGGEAELLILSKMLKASINVYIKNPQGGGYLCIVRYGDKFDRANGGKRKPVRLLYNGSNHYDLLLAV